MEISLSAAWNALVQNISSEYLPRATPWRNLADHSRQAPHPHGTGIRREEDRTHISGSRDTAGT